MTESTRREGEDREWTKVIRRRSNRGRNRSFSKEDDLSRMASTYYVTNLPEHWNSSRLWRTFQGMGTLVDAFIPGKKDLSGCLFGFVRFIKVSNIGVLLERLNEMVLEGRRLRANVARHVRSKTKNSEEVRRIPVDRKVERKNAKENGSRWVYVRKGDPSFAAVLKGDGRDRLEMTGADKHKPSPTPCIMIPE
ncbi:hypothetical protein LXL04_007079 [Taraxacum kok-saghyz]